MTLVVVLNVIALTVLFGGVAVLNVIAEVVDKKRAARRPKRRRARRRRTNILAQYYRTFRFRANPII